MNQANGVKRKLIITSLIITIFLGSLALGGLGYDKIKSNMKVEKQIETNTQNIKVLDLQAKRNEVMLMAIIRKFELEETVQKEINLLGLQKIK